jgi:hypothetical protein
VDQNDNTANEGQQFDPPMGESRAQSQESAPQNALPVSKLIVLGLLALSIIGLTLSLQGATLLSGTATQWTGASLAVVGAIAAWILRKNASRWVVPVLTTLVAVGALANVIYLEIQVNEKRQELNDIFDTDTSWDSDFSWDDTP